MSCLDSSHGKSPYGVRCHPLCDCKQNAQAQLLFSTVNLGISISAGVTQPVSLSIMMSINSSFDARRNSNVYFDMRGYSSGMAMTGAHHPPDDQLGLRRHHLFPITSSALGVRIQDPIAAPWPRYSSSRNDIL